MTTERDPILDHIERKGENPDPPNVPYDGGEVPVPDADDPSQARGEPSAEGETTQPADGTPDPEGDQ